MSIYPQKAVTARINVAMAKVFKYLIILLKSIPPIINKKMGRKTKKRTGTADKKKEPPNIYCDTLSFINKLNSVAITIIKVNRNDKGLRSVNRYDNIPTEYRPA